MPYKTRDTGPVDRERSAIRIFMNNLGAKFTDPEFETDARTFQIGNEEWLFSTDEFSSEDNFRSHNPETLGWNVTAATLSDIFAAGGIPLFYGHSATLQHDWSDHFIDSFSRGVAQCLAEAGTTFLGGDLGISDHWKYTGIVIGKKLTALNRAGAQVDDLIYMTGHAGTGNLEAALELYSDNPSLHALLRMIHVRFPVRKQEAAMIRKYANCCIDSSDGLFRALQDFARLGKVGFRISKIPYDGYGSAACKILGKPQEILFFGECGEYELIFTIPPAKEHELLSEAAQQQLKFSKLGIITGNNRMTLDHRGTVLDLSGYSIYARNYPDVKDYIAKVIEFIENGSG